MPSIALLVTIGLTLLFVAVTAGLFAHNRGAKTLLAGLGVSLLPFGLYLFGLTDLIVNGVRSLVDWAQRTVFDTWMTVGAVMFGVGILLLIISAFVKPRTRQRPAQGSGAASAQQPRPAAGQQPRPAVGSGGASAPTAASRSGGSGTSSAATPGKGKDKAGDNDDEIEEILRRRGIM